MLPTNIRRKKLKNVITIFLKFLKIFLKNLTPVLSVKVPVKPLMPEPSLLNKYSVTLQPLGGRFEATRWMCLTDYDVTQLFLLVIMSDSSKNFQNLN